MKKFTLISILFVSRVFFIGLGGYLIKQVGARFKSDEKRSLKLIRLARAGNRRRRGILTTSVQSLTISGKATKTFDAR